MKNNWKIDFEKKIHWFDYFKEYTDYAHRTNHVRYFVLIAKRDRSSYRIKI